SGAEGPRWMVFNDRGDLIDHSRNLADENLLAARAPRLGKADLPGRVVDRQGRPWRISVRRVRPVAVPAPGSRAAARAAPADAETSGTFHPGLVLTVAAPLGPMEATL